MYAHDDAQITVPVNAPAVYVTPGDGSVTVFLDDHQPGAVDPSHWTPLQRQLMVLRLRVLADELEAGNA